jgi:uncharacterized PurR-regulated membrane protein YhhQ (DUF165 family)
MARRVVRSGSVFANILLIMVGVFVVWFPAAPEWKNQEAFESLFYVVPRFVVASLVAFWLGEFTNSYTLANGSGRGPSG